MSLLQGDIIDLSSPRLGQVCLWALQPQCLLSSVPAGSWFHARPGLSTCQMGADPVKKCLSREWPLSWVSGVMLSPTVEYLLMHEPPCREGSPRLFSGLQVLRGLAFPGLLVIPTTAISMPHSGFQTCHLSLPFAFKSVTPYLFCVPEPPSHPINCYWDRVMNRQPAFQSTCLSMEAPLICTHRILDV